MKRFVLLFLFTLFIINNGFAGQYYVNVGEETNIYCNQTAPSGGWITHVFYGLVDSSDAQYLAIYNNPSEGYATVRGLSPKSSIKIEVTYAYSYRGTYDNNIHVGHGTYYDYVTVKGGGAATDIRFNPSGVNMKTGETVKVKLEITPANTSSTYEWGIIESVSSRPSYYEITQEKDKELIIMAKRAMNLYLYAKTSNGLQATCIIRAKDDAPDDAIQPTNISMSTNEEILHKDETKQLEFILTPSNASTVLTWESDNENICSVSTSGKITAINEGMATITVTTSNGLKAKCSVTVATPAKSVSLPKTKDLTLGYRYVLEPTINPVYGYADWIWESSDNNIVTVDQNGVLTIKRTGSAIITITAKDTNIKAECNVNVKEPDAVTDSRNVNNRLQTIDNLINHSLQQMK